MKNLFEAKSINDIRNTLGNKKPVSEIILMTGSDYITAEVNQLYTELRVHSQASGSAQRWFIHVLEKSIRWNDSKRDKLIQEILKNVHNKLRIEPVTSGAIDITRKGDIIFTSTLGIKHTEKQSQRIVNYLTSTYDDRELKINDRRR